MTTNVRAVIDRVLAVEGGVVQLPGENFVTRYGQTPAWLEDNGLIPPMTAEQAIANYETWMTKTHLAEICDRDVALGHLLVDFAVNSGLTRAVRALQMLLAVTPDGVIGPQTLRALSVTDVASLRRRLLAERLRFIGQILKGNPNVRQFAGGWLNRVADQIEALL